MEASQEAETGAPPTALPELLSEKMSLSWGNKTLCWNSHSNTDIGMLTNTPGAQIPKESDCCNEMMMLGNAHDPIEQQNQCCRYEH